MLVSGSGKSSEEHKASCFSEIRKEWEFITWREALLKEMVCYSRYEFLSHMM
jgi:hypothetical protein